MLKPNNMKNKAHIEILSQEVMSIAESKVSDIIPFIQIVSKQNNLKFNRRKQFNQAKAIMMRSILFN
jgi:hypothetical protein